MSQPSTQARGDTAHQYRRYGLFGGAVVGAVAGLLGSGPNFHEWAATQSIAVVLGFTLLIALIGHFFLALVLGAFTGVSTLSDEQEEEEEEENDPVKRETPGISAGSSDDGD